MFNGTLAQLFPKSRRTVLPEPAQANGRYPQATLAGVEAARSCCVLQLLLLLVLLPRLEPRFFGYRGTFFLVSTPLILGLGTTM